MKWRSSTIVIAVAGASLACPGCVPRSRMCTAQSDCSGSVACVAGRCQPDKPNVKPAIETARRVIARPVDVAYLRRGDGSSAAPPPVFALGRDSAVFMMRFAVALPSTANVLEAYVVLRRSDAVDDDPAAISLHATRIVERWDGRSTSWARQPRLFDTRAPATVVEPGGPALVRLDVRDLVRQWPRQGERDQGIAIVAENESRSGTTFAFRSVGAERASASEPQRSSSGPDVDPFLELYLR